MNLPAPDPQRLPAPRSWTLALLLAAALAGCQRPAEPPAPPAAPPAATAPAPAQEAAPAPPQATAPAVPSSTDATAPTTTAEGPMVEGEDSQAAPDQAGVNPNLSFARRAGLHRTKDPLRLTASAAVLVDQSNGAVLFRKNDEAVLPIASLTKLMTGLILLQADVPLDQEIAITADDVDTARNSRSRLRVGTTLTRAEALHLALMSSENRAAHALGRTFPGGMAAFVEAMNNKARALGMKQTTFVDPTGLSNRNQSTARDLALLATATSRYPLLRDYSTTPRHQVTYNGRTLQYLNSNRLIKDPDWSISLQKTGYIVEAGQCLAMRTRVGGRDVVMVLLDAGSKTTRSTDAQRLRRWVQAQENAGENLAAAAPRKDAATQGGGN